MRDKFLRAVSSALARARSARSKPRPKPPEPAWTRWYGRPVHDHDGLRLGHVVRLTPDGGDGAWVRVCTDWGVLDWLPSIGAAEHPMFTFHSTDVEESGAALVLKAVGAAHR